jgi:hypothetical protein
LSNGNNNDWEHRIVKELDLALNQWIDEMPDHRARLSVVVSLHHFDDLFSALEPFA